MCLCLEKVWSSLTYICCCDCFKQEESEKSKKKRKKKRRSIKTADSSKDSFKAKESPVGPLKTVSEINENELIDKYMISLPKDNCDDQRQWLRTLGYEITDIVLGSGGYGKVFKAIKYDTTGRIDIAVKILDLDPGDSKHNKAMDSLKNELFISDALIKQIDKIKHNHIIKIYDRFVIENKTKDAKIVSNAYFFMEMAEGDLDRELERLNSPLPDMTAKRYFAQIVYAIEYMHRLNIAHRDLKLGNFLLVKSVTVPDQKDIKVSDFGLSRVQYKDTTGFIYSMKSGGTPCYKAPEILRVQAQLSSKEYDPFKADIWALGVCLYRMLTFKYPFDSNYYRKSRLEALRKTIESQENKEITLDFPKHFNITIDSKAKDLIRRLLEPNPEKRPKIYTVKIHKWLEGENTITLTVTATT